MGPTSRDQRQPGCRTIRPVVVSWCVIVSIWPFGKRRISFASRKFLDNTRGMKKPLCGSDGRVTVGDQPHNWAACIAMGTGKGEDAARAGESHMAESIFDAITGGEPEGAAAPASGPHPVAATLYLSAADKAALVKVSAR